MLPPEDVSPSELWQKLQETPKPSEVVDFPRRDAEGRSVGKLRIQVLDVSQHDEARLSAHKWLRETKRISNEDIKGPSIQEVYGDAVARHILAAACCNVEPIKGTEHTASKRYTRTFPNGAGDLEKLSGDELTVLFTSWQMVQTKYGPYERNIESAEELNAWIVRLGEGADAFPLAAQSWPQLVELTISLAQRACFLSGILESQSSTWPDSLRSRLEPLGMGTGYFGRQQSDDEASGSTAIPPPTETEVERAMGLLPNEPITAKDAAIIAKKLFGGNTG